MGWVCVCVCVLKKFFFLSVHVPRYFPPEEGSPKTNCLSASRASARGAVASMARNTAWTTGGTVVRSFVSWAHRSAAAFMDAHVEHVHVLRVNKWDRSDVSSTTDIEGGVASPPTRSRHKSAVNVSAVGRLAVSAGGPMGAWATVHVRWSEGTNTWRPQCHPGATWTTSGTGRHFVHRVHWTHRSSMEGGFGGDGGGGSGYSAPGITRADNK